MSDLTQNLGTLHDLINRAESAEAALARVLTLMDDSVTYYDAGEPVQVVELFDLRAAVEGAATNTETRAIVCDMFCGDGMRCDRERGHTGRCSNRRM